MYESSIRGQLIESATITMKILFFIFLFWFIYLFSLLLITKLQHKQNKQKMVKRKYSSTT